MATPRLTHTASRVHSLFEPIVQLTLGGSAPNHASYNVISVDAVDAIDPPLAESLVGVFRARLAMLTLGAQATVATSPEVPTHDDAHMHLCCRPKEHNGRT